MEIVYLRKAMFSLNNTGEEQREDSIQKISPGVNTVYEHTQNREDTYLPCHLSSNLQGDC